MNNLHPYISFGQALVMLENDLKYPTEITSRNLKDEIEIGISSFRTLPSEAFEGKEKIKYQFGKIEKGNPEKGIFLSPSIITTDMLAKNTWKGAQQLIEKNDTEDLTINENATMALSPLSGEYLSFSTNGGIGRGKPKSNLLEMSLSMITTLTSSKPCLQDRGVNACIIPDLPLDKMIDFIRFFKQMKQHKSAETIYYGRVKQEEKGKGTNKEIIYKPVRPQLFQGNFPNPPRSTTLGAVALLATIGEFTKEAEYSERAKKVLEDLKETSLYLIKYGDAKSFTYNHYVLELAKKGNLRRIVDSLYYSKLYNQTRRDYKNTEYQKFDLFTSRFLQLFNHAAFKDFLAFRAEYPNEIKLLFNTYFENMEKIDSKIVTSARHLGKWLNLVAYYAAKREVNEGSSNYWEKIREQKAKVLIELESSTFSAKSGDAIIAQVVTRAGRLSGMDAPPEATLFMEKTCSGDLPIDHARNLLIAFSRLKNAREENHSNDSDEQIQEMDNNYQDS